jgi:hypothetical protein
MSIRKATISPAKNGTTYCKSYHKNTPRKEIDLKLFFEVINASQNT